MSCTKETPINITEFKSEILAFPEVENPVDTPREWKCPNLHVESDYAFGGFTSGESNVTTFWEADSAYTSQVNWKMESPCLLESKLAVGPDIDLEPATTFENFHTYELFLNGADREENALQFVKRMYILGLTMDKGYRVNHKRIERLYYDVMGLRA